MSELADDLRFPIGPFVDPGKLDAAARSAAIEAIEATPASLRSAVAGLDEGQLETPYRPGGWTVRQVVHHLPDSHLNSYARFKLGLTEEEPNRAAPPRGLVGNPERRPTKPAKPG